MFRQFSRRIFLILFLAGSVCATSIGAVSYFFARHLILSEFASISDAYFRTSSDNLTLYMNYVEETTRMISTNPTVISALSSESYLTGISSLLNDIAVTSNLDIRGITLYALNGYTYSGNNYSGYPTLEQLRENPEIDRFLSEPALREEWFFRTDQPQNYYSSLRSSQGGFSYAMKIPAQNRTALMIVDLDASKIASFFATGNHLFDRSSIYLMQDQTKPIPLTVPLELNAGDLDKVNRHLKVGAAWRQTIGSRLFLLEPIPDSNVRLLLTIPLANATGFLSELKSLIVLLSILAAFFSAYLFRRLKKTIIKPLYVLYRKMRKFNTVS